MPHDMHLGVANRMIERGFDVNSTDEVSTTNG